LLSKIKKLKLKNYFIIVLVLSSIYIGFIKTSFFQSTGIITIKNLDDSSSTSGLLGLVSGQSNDTIQDAMVLQEYLKSYEVYEKLNKDFDLSAYYNSFELDFLQRMYGFNSYEDYIKLYNKHLNIDYDEVSNITTISFLHVEAQKAQEIVGFLINEAEYKLNQYNKNTATKQLSFIEEETNKQKEVLERSIKRLAKYQDTQNTLNPNSQASTNISILSELKGKLVENSAKLEKLSKYLTNNAFEIIDLKREISQIKSSINQVKKEQSGSGDKTTLNKSIFEFEKINSEVTLNTELYKQALLQQQSAKIDVNKENKTLQVLVNPNFAQSYSEPKRFRELLTLIIILSLLYGILSMLNAIIKDHKE
jgi:capsular polysaccharide transport system permease protein